MSTELENWKRAFKAKWDYERTQVQFLDGNGNSFTLAPPSTTSTTPLTTSPWPNNTHITTNPVAVVTISTTTPRADQVVSGSTSDLLKLIGITVGVLLVFLLCLGGFIVLCRRSKRKRDRNVSVRRPLEGPEPEEHIYAEIEPLQQYGRANDSGGASGTTSDIPLPARKRRRGISSFNGLSMRIQKFFSHRRKSADEQSVFYKRNGETVMQTVAEAPEPPERNMNGNNIRDKGKKVQRFESTASRRPLLDGDSQVSQPSTSSVELRNSTYNTLMKNEDSRESGPYDTLNKATKSEDTVDTDEPSSPHDYFTLEKNKFPINDEDSPIYNGGSEIVTLEHEPGNMETIAEADSESDTEDAATAGGASHDYFVLEPHEREKSKKGKNGENNSSEDTSAKPIIQGTGKGENDNLASDKQKPTPKPRLNKSPSGETSPSGEAKPSNESSDNKNLNDYVPYKDAMKGRNNSKEDDYEISKLGDAPKPPEQTKEGGDREEEEEEENDYLKPVKEQARVYVDVFPNPPPRTTSLFHDSDSPSTERKDLSSKPSDPPSSYVSSPSKPTGPPGRSKSSPSKSPNKSRPSPKPKTSSTKSAGPPAKSANTSPSTYSPIKVVGSPTTKSAGSPVRLSGVPTKSTETEV